MFLIFCVHGLLTEFRAWLFLLRVFLLSSLLIHSEFWTFSFARQSAFSSPLNFSRRLVTICCWSQSFLFLVWSCLALVPFILSSEINVQ